jgi:hypothetical protein
MLKGADDSRWKCGDWSGEKTVGATYKKKTKEEKGQTTMFTEKKIRLVLFLLVALIGFLFLREVGAFGDVTRPGVSEHRSRAEQQVSLDGAAPATPSIAKNREISSSETQFPTITPRIRIRW